jgi:hypothetical protein
MRRVRCGRQRGGGGWGERENAVKGSGAQRGEEESRGSAALWLSGRTES